VLSVGKVEGGKWGRKTVKKNYLSATEVLELEALTRRM
jgi:hypothetical protein